MAAAVLAGIAVGLLSLAALIAALAVFVRAVALLLPPAGQFLGDVQGIREANIAWTTQAPRRSAAPSWAPSGAAGIAPAPEVEEPTSAEVPSGLTGGDLDRFDIDASGLERPLAPGSRHAEPPPGG